MNCRKCDRNLDQRGLLQAGGVRCHSAVTVECTCGEVTQVEPGVNYPSLHRPETHWCFQCQAKRLFNYCAADEWRCHVCNWRLPL